MRRRRAHRSCHDACTLWSGLCSIWETHFVGAVSNSQRPRHGHRIREREISTQSGSAVYLCDERQPHASAMNIRHPTELFSCAMSEHTPPCYRDPELTRHRIPRRFAISKSSVFKTWIARSTAAATAEGTATLIIAMSLRDSREPCSDEASKARRESVSSLIPANGSSFGWVGTAPNRSRTAAQCSTRSLA
jgi:hypothetical protein